MDKKIGEQLAQKGLDILNQTQAFVLEQAPDFMQQILAWQYAKSVVGIVLCAVIIIVLFVGTHLAAKNTSDGFPYVFNIFQIPPIAFGCEHVYTLIQIYYAPKIFLLEYLSGLVK